MQHNVPRYRGAAVALASLTIAALAGCSSSAGGSADTSAAASGTTTQAPQPAAQSAVPSAAAHAPSTDNVVTIDALDSGSAMSYKISGSPHAGLATITFTNKGDEAHEMG